MSTAPETPLQQQMLSTTEIAAAPALAERWMTELQTLLKELETMTAATATLPPLFGAAVDERLVQSRLGIAASLFAALECKNAAAAGHALRVALSCSSWAMKMGLPEEDREAIEIAALLHDIGVIGAPDQILLKPGQLDEDEAAVMDRCKQMSLDILKRSCASPKVLEIVEGVRAWYDHSRRGTLANDAQLPLGARMIAIVEAFDAMTTDHVYRPACSQERAIAELFQCAGTQFDPELVDLFNEFCREDQTMMRGEAARRWLRSLDATMASSYWHLNSGVTTSAVTTIDSMFQIKLLDTMYDAVIFVDTAGRILQWNRGAERLTGITGASIQGQMWHPLLLAMTDEKGTAIAEPDCPVLTAIRSGVQSLRRLTILGRRQQGVAVDSHAIPVIDQKGVTHGAVLVFHDASSETSLEQRCQSLHEKATKDPLTQVANRAEFDRVHETFVDAHQQQQVPCSMLMCDLDRFKTVNDTYGHQAGDDVIKSLASLLKSSCRPGDLVARYGGEEFVVLCADCDNATAVRRAKQICLALSQISQPKMGGRSITVSIGVTEVQPGDTPETMLRRADRALLMAKDSGRNTVVQLGTGVGAETEAIRPGSRLSSSAGPNDLFEQHLVTPVPVKIAVDKLRGFVADHEAKVVSVNGNQVRIEIGGKPVSRLRRLTDRPVTFVLDVEFEEEMSKRTQPGGGATRTKIKVTIGTRETRNRRQKDVATHAREILISFRSYLMASECEPLTSPGVVNRVKQIFSPRRGQK
jgi:diguanylate cyclase (GGDEF)-like protein/PAS domain S-box-containing protein